jgi:hypothetical protein
VRGARLAAVARSRFVREPCRLRGDLVLGFSRGARALDAWR